MTTLEMTYPAERQRRRFTRVAANAAVLVAVAFALAGTAALGANALRDGHGYFNWPSEPFSSGGYAIAMKTVDISKAPNWALDAGIQSVRVQAHSNPPLFIGIARTADVDRYLRGVEHDDISGLSYHPFQLDYDHKNGVRPERSPSTDRFWVKSISGSGTVSLDWKPRPGSWRAVIMNADNSRSVNADVKLGVRTPVLWWLGGALFAASLLAGAGAAALYRRARR